MKCLSLFSGAGGLDLGLEAAGFEIIASIENDGDCCATLRDNGRKNVIKGDVGSVDFRAVGAANKVDLVVGGPPCQPFSKSALWTHNGVRGLSDPRTRTIGLFVEAIEQLRPRAFILENVEGFAKLGGLEALSSGLSELAGENANYSMHSCVLSAADFGVPQKRRRFFAVGVLNGVKFEFPTPTHGLGRQSYTSAWDACSAASNSDQVEEELAVKGRWARLLPTIPPGRNYLWHTNRGGGRPIFGWRTRYWSFLYKLAPADPSPTIVANPSQNSGPFHWDNRLLSTRELAAIQTFPLNYDFAGDRSSRQRQIGNAVPPLLAEHLGRALMASLGRPPSAELRFALKVSTSKPTVPQAGDLPIEFETLVGRHADHPGAGLGPRPRRPIKRPEEAAP